MTYGCRPLGDTKLEHRPEVLPPDRMDHVIHDGGDEQHARHPVEWHPVELDPDDRDERGDQQGEHGDRHEPVERAGPEGVALDLLGDRGSGRRADLFVGLGRTSPHPQCVPDQEEHGPDDREPHEIP
jgi:hypothetical protein